MVNDPVNHPAHYIGHPSGVECITITEWMNFNLGNAVKYIWRAGEKGKLVEDLQKARWYLDREIARLENPVLPVPRQSAAAQQKRMPRVSSRRGGRVARRRAPSKA